AEAGIGVGVGVAGVALLVGLLVWALRRRKERVASPISPSNAPLYPHVAAENEPHELVGRSVYELDEQRGGVLGRDAKMMGGPRERHELGAGSTLSRVFALLSALSLLQGSQAIIYQSRFNGTTWDDDNWRVTTTDLVPGIYQSRMSLANGYLGINLAAIGPFFEVDSPSNINGWPLFDRRQTFATIAGFYDREDRVNGTNFAWLYQYDTGESVISGVPHWAGLHVQVGDQILDASVPSDQISRFSSTLDVGAGTMSWAYTWSPSNESAIDVEYTMLVHKLYVNQAAVQLKMTASRDVNASVIDLLDGDCAVRTNFVGKGFESAHPTIWSAVSPVGVDNVTAYIASSMVGDDSCDAASRTNYTMQSVIGANSSSIAQAMNVALKAGQTSIVTKYVGGASTDAFSNPQSTAMNGSWSAAAEGFSAMLESQIAEWSNILPADSVDSY
ncbi:hypothetical protein B0A55_13606, partial [Friedmanniomyces simplex]